MRAFSLWLQFSASLNTERRIKCCGAVTVYDSSNCQHAPKFLFIHSGVINGAGCCWMRLSFSFLLTARVQGIQTAQNHSASLILRVDPSGITYSCFLHFRALFL